MFPHVAALSGFSYVLKFTVIRFSCTSEVESQYVKQFVARVLIILLLQLDANLLKTALVNRQICISYNTTNTIGQFKLISML